MKHSTTVQGMKLMRDSRRMTFRKETFDIVFHYYQDENSGEQFTTTALDELNITQVHNQYRDRFNLPFTEDVIKTRQKYGLSATKMSEILGFGVNTYRQYEAGEVPSVANGKMIKMADNPKNFRGLIKLNTTLKKKQREQLLKGLAHKIEERKQNTAERYLERYLMGGVKADEYSGFRIPNLSKLTQMIVFFAEQLQPFKTKMNKLLFYADFLMYQKYGFSISGTRYRAIEMGPVPQNFQSVYEYLINHQILTIEIKLFPKGYSGERFKIEKSSSFDRTLFTHQELETLENVKTVFQGEKTKHIIELSHEEKGWLENQKEKKLIDYRYAFDLCGEGECEKQGNFLKESFKK